MPKCIWFTGQGNGLIATDCQVGLCNECGSGIDGNGLRTLTPAQRQGSEGRTSVPPVGERPTRLLDAARRQARDASHSDLTRVKSSKHQPQRSDVVSDSVKPVNARKRFAFDLVDRIRRKTQHAEWRESVGLPSI